MHYSEGRGVESKLRHARIVTAIHADHNVRSTVPNEVASIELPVYPGSFGILWDDRHCPIRIVVYLNRPS